MSQQHLRINPAGLMLLAGLLLGAADASSQATVYRCDGPAGPRFSDSPCGPGQQTITIRDNHIGGSFGDNLPDPLADYDPSEETAPERSEKDATREPRDTCRFINSTDLRTYLARNQVVPGMTREQVQRAFGRTSEVYPVPQETWVYQTRYYGAIYELTYVYFRNGCVERVEYRKP